MTFTPTPKADLWDFDVLYEAEVAVGQQIVSRLHHAEEAANWAATQIAALYAALPDVLDSTWAYVGTDVSHNPGMDRVTVRVNSDQSRTFALSKKTFTLDDLKQGSTVVLTDDTSSPPVTAFRQYTVTTDPVDHGSWVSFESVRIATFGALTTPTVGATVRLLLR